MTETKAKDDLEANVQAQVKSEMNAAVAALDDKFSKSLDEFAMKQEQVQSPPPDNANFCCGRSAMFWILLLAATTVIFLIATIDLAVLYSQAKGEVDESNAVNVAPVSEIIFASVSAPDGDNICADKNPELESIQCVVNDVTMAKEQAAANVTKGYQGLLDTQEAPISTPFWMNAMCPVNVHWHIGAEHYSLGQFDETGTGPTDASAHHRRAAEGEARPGYQCKLYDEKDAKFTMPYRWEHCKDMEVGQTYEVHWPHSAAGACGTPNQYQTPFYDGVFCRDGIIDDGTIASQIGVQAQVFTIVNDEEYYWPDLIRGMIVDGVMGQDLAIYTGSTTGDSVNNEVCSAYSPITWQVDRTCHLISASSFDKMCADMKAQRDDMSDDLHPHGSRELVADELAANNHNNLRG